MEDLRFPVGKFDMTMEPAASTYGELIDGIAAAPARMRKAVAGLNDEQLDTPYRPEGWSARQVVHHVPDSHLNAYVRFKLALTEDNPTIRPYEEARWAELNDSRETPIAVSLQLLESLHERWVILLRSLKPADFQRTLFHPEHKLSFTLSKMLGMYEWHSRHHVAHITELRKRMNWD